MNLESNSFTILFCSSVELVSLRESEEKLKQQQLEATRRENILVMRLTTKEQEMQDYANQIQELKQGQISSVAQLRSALLDPAVNLMFEKMRKELDGVKAQLEETQNELSAWKFTPDSNTGKRLMAKCRLLYQENEELGKMISSGRMAKLEGDLALQRNFSEAMKKSQDDLDDLLLALDEEVEGMQSTIYYLQLQLREAKDQISKYLHENQKLTNLLNLSSIKEEINGLDAINCNKDVNQKSAENTCQSSMSNAEKPDSSLPTTLKLELVVEPPSNQDAISVASRESSPSIDNRTETSSNSNPVIEKKVASPILGTNALSTEQTSDNQRPAVDCNNKPTVPSENHRQSFTTESLNGSSFAAETINNASEEELTTTQTTNDVPSDISSSDTESGADSSGGRKYKRKFANSRTNSPVADGAKRRKRAKSQTSPEGSTTEEETQFSQSPKRLRTEHAHEHSPDRNSINIEIDTDTEVQVAQTLACWAAANKERKESQLRAREHDLCSLGNGELDCTSVSEEGDL
ncbi:pre-mRNA-splicing regulator WTAP-like [Centruroides sculpturatus]|uniref:pre-mRNA-splicing regulator WTAP-like n=1 Tax=Centruroides sculpturatus TaxID=218467 RepID=UPI000C6ECA33|nr:pre-mRNA-splicing regulator WTAP-like [Centruroides sculpturatus]